MKGDLLDELERRARQRLNDEAHAVFTAEYPTLEPELLGLYQTLRDQLVARGPAEGGCDQVTATRQALAAMLQAAYKRGYLRGAVARPAAAIGRN
ncbi:MAG TPA: hypothetical protein VFL91_27225 [Thermomicrobiales bacterium]|nr:hypothetical protein [Thermomicrobiales bacterium]